jgi:glycosyltransferase involved in cell wall biosynthesis
LNKRYNNVKYLGEVPHKDLHKIYVNCDLFIMPSRRETFGNVALEAQACGLPVIASDIPGPSDIIIDGVTGTLLREKSDKALVSAINMYYRLWFQDYEKYREVSMNARQNAMKYDWRIVSKRLYDMLVNVYRERGSSD